MFPVTFTNGRYRVGELTLTRTTAAGASTSAIPQWSVTEVFEGLIPRYWPSITVTEQPGSQPADEAAKKIPDEPS